MPPRDLDNTPRNDATVESSSDLGLQQIVFVHPYLKPKIGPDPVKEQTKNNFLS